MALTDTLAAAGAAAFGGSMPLLAPSWLSGATPTVNADGLTLASGGSAWLAPLAGYTRTAAQAASRSGVFLRRPDGSQVPSDASVLSLYPQQYLRLARLYALILEGTGRPEAARGQPARPVPAHLVLPAGVAEGGVDPGDTLIAGALSVHDQYGQPVDAVAVAGAFAALLAAHPPLQAVALGSSPVTPPPLAAMATALAGGTTQTRVRLVGPSGSPAPATSLTGLTAVAGAGTGLFTAAAAGTIGKAAVSASFDAEAARTLVLGLATTGRLGDSLTLPAVSSGISLARDFFAVRVLDLRRYLIGAPSAQWAGTRIEPRPAVRRDEPLTFLPDGNDILGAAGAALGGTAGPGGLAESIAVAPQIDGAFGAPVAGPGDAAHWPGFPAAGAATAPDGPVPIALRSGLAPTAVFVTGGTAAAPSIDVVLALHGLPPGASVRAYHRVFSADAVESRGDGAGGVADSAGTVTLLLHDPLGLRRPGQPPPASVPADPVLHVDVVVVKRKGEARIFGDVSAPITGSAAPPPPGSNPFGSAARRAICRSGMLGLGGSPVPPAGTSAVAAALMLLSEGNPRDAPRLPGMTRRDLIVAGLAAVGGSWRAVLGAGRLAGELHNAAPRLGAPGGTGGRETQAAGVATAGGRLAYDIARAGLRRTTSIVTRLVPLAGTAWNEPPVPSGTAAGTFAGAVLQSVASGCDTPELSLLRTLNIVDPDDPNFPRTFDALVDKVQAWATSLIGQLPAGLPGAAQTGLNDLVAKMQDLKDNAPADEAVKERIFNELLREVAASGWGRRDAQWALAEAIGRAERFAYIETPGLAATAAAGAADPFAVDLFAALTARLSANPALHVAVCCPREPDYPFGFNPFRDLEASSRHDALLALPTAALADPVASRVVAFHPVGFPGRPSRLESTVVIIDDVWALVGSSTLRRRGLTFDGGADVVCTDLALTEGRSAAIAGFRRTLQAARLGIGAPSAPPALPPSSFVRLGDGVDACHEIREMLRGGGLGRIERLAPPEPVGRPPAPGPADAVNPDGETVDLPNLLALLVLAGAASA